MPTTYFDIVEMVPAAAGIDVITIDGFDLWPWSSCLLSMIIDRLSGGPQRGSKAVDGEFSFTDQVFVDSLAFISQMVDDGLISENVTSINYGINMHSSQVRQMMPLMPAR